MEPQNCQSQNQSIPSIDIISVQFAFLVIGLEASRLPDSASPIGLVHLPIASKFKIDFYFIFNFEQLHFFYNKSQPNELSLPLKGPTL